MDWYYLEGDQQKGPVSEDAIVSLARTGTIQPETLVWREGFDDWHPYSQLAGAIAGAPTAPSVALETAPEPSGATEFCVECGKPYPSDSLAQYGNSFVCEICKPIFVQRIQEGVALPGEFDYGGFWIRLVAKFIDGIILGVVGGAVQIAIMAFFGFAGDSAEALAIGLSYISGLVIGAAYTTVFLGAFAATPGKMICGLKVVRANGDAITYLRAFARHLAEYLSYFILLIGYIMAAFDDEKRALHDHLCDTRVIHT